MAEPQEEIPGFEELTPDEKATYIDALAFVRSATLRQLTKMRALLGATIEGQPNHPHPPRLLGAIDEAISSKRRGER